jgi:hypothetical protein
MPRTAKNIRKAGEGYGTNILYNMRKITTPVTDTYSQIGKV